MKLTDNIYYGKSSEFESGLPEGSIFINTDTGEINVIGSDGKKLENEAIEKTTGWSAYVDTQYTEGSTFSIVSDTKVTLPNNASSKIESQMPSDFDKMYDESTLSIIGKNGDGLNITCEFFVIPDVGATTLETSIDIGGAVGEIFPRLFTFPKGSGVTRPISFSISVYTLDTWQANGGQIKIISNGNCEIFGIRYVLTRTHKAH